MPSEGERPTEALALATAEGNATAQSEAAAATGGHWSTARNGEPDAADADANAVGASHSTQRDGARNGGRQWCFAMQGGVWRRGHTVNNGRNGGG